MNNLIFNIMMSRALGGIQQAYIDYNHALLSQGYKVINIASTKAKINHLLTPNHSLPNLSQWCILSKIYLSVLIKRYNPNIIICHGNRAISFTINSLKSKNIKIIGVSHNYSYHKIKKCNFIITISQDVQKYLIQHKISENKIFTLSNMVKITNPYKPIVYNYPITIGSLGRFVKKKGFTYLVESIKLLKESGYNIKLLLGGAGEEKRTLQCLVNNLCLQKEVQLLEWINNKEEFFNKIDIFCLPSVSEPFGIILLEAIAHSKPVVATNSGGPQDILRHKKDGLIVSINSKQDLANSLLRLIQSPQLANTLSQSAYYRIKTHFDMQIVAKQLSQILRNLT